MMSLYKRPPHGPPVTSVSRRCVADEREICRPAIRREDSRICRGKSTVHFFEKWGVCDHRREVGVLRWVAVQFKQAAAGVAVSPVRVVVDNDAVIRIVGTCVTVLPHFAHQQLPQGTVPVVHDVALYDGTGGGAERVVRLCTTTDRKLSPRWRVRLPADPRPLVDGVNRRKARRGCTMICLVHPG